jgi:Mrp family chromosome partitioning ATPase
MSENCNEACGTCSVDCTDRKEPQEDFSAKLHDYSTVKKVIGIVSGKGGVGKSLLTSMLAVTMQRRGHHVPILDADITGPSIPMAFGLTGKVAGSEFGLYPLKSKTGIDIMSINLILDNDTDPVIWRGPIIAGVVKQFWSDVIWDDIDFMFIDLPPGTGDVPLTVFQSIKIDGIIIVTSPQELVSMIVSKAAKMAAKMNIPIIGLVENMAYYQCPDCGKEHSVFGESHVWEIAKEHNVELLARMPIDPKISKACDRGLIELFENNWLDKIPGILEKDME